MKHHLSHTTLISVAMIFCMVSCGKLSTTREQRRAIAEGNKAYSAKEYTKASAEYTKALSENPDIAEARYDKALAGIRIAALPDSDENKRKELLATAVSEMGATAAIGAANPAIASVSNYNLGNVAFNGEDYGKAIEYYKQALRFNPDDEQARRNLRIAQKKQNDKNQDKQNNQDKDKQDKQEQKQEQKQDNEQQKDQDKNKEEEQQPRDNSMSSRTAEQILNAMENKESATRARINATGTGDKSSASRAGRKNW